jgi:hypothetical protein
LTKLDDLGEFIRNKSKKNVDTDPTPTPTKEKEFSIVVAGSEATTNPLASFGDDLMDMDLIDQLCSSPKSRPLRGEGASYWD